MLLHRTLVCASALFLTSQIAAAVDPVLPAASPHDGLKNRIISIDPNNPAKAIAMKLVLINRTCSVTAARCNVDADCKQCGGLGAACQFDADCGPGLCLASGETCVDAGAPVMLGWVSDPVDAGGDALPSTWHSVVQPTKPTHRTWSETVVHIADCEIAPVHTYRITAEASDALGVFSMPLNIGTIFKPGVRSWADVVGRFNGAGWDPPDGLVSIDDVVAVVKFLILDFPEPLVTQVNLAGPAPSFINWNVTVTDLQLVIESFQGFAFPPLAFTLDSPAYPAGGNVTLCPQAVLSRGGNLGETGVRTGGPASVLELVPVSSSSASASIVGNEISLVPGEEVQVELSAFLSGWGNLPGAPELSAYHVTLEGSSLLGINAAPSRPGVDLLAPAAVACDGDGDCASGFCDFNSGAFCNDTLPAFIRDKVCLDAPEQWCNSGNQCPGLPICVDSPEFGLQGCNPVLASVFPASRDYEWFGACFGGARIDPGTPRYIGSLRVIVPTNATGTYTINWRAGIDRSFANDQNVRPMPAPTLVSAVIKIASSCCTGGSCTLQVESACTAGGGTVVPACLGDADVNGVDDACEADCDGDGTLDLDETDPADQDCDSDGICNGVEIASCSGSDPRCADCDANGVPDECDIASGTSTDCNNNNVPDRCEIAVGSIGPGGPFFCTANCEPDCNNSGLPDSCDVDRGTSKDCNGNGVPDECSSADGSSDACNGNGIPDSCEAWACCLDQDGDGLFEGCTMTSEALCLQAGGNYRGPCKVCSVQNTGIIPEPGGQVFVHVIGPPIDCLADTGGRAAARGGCAPGVPKIDPWKSTANAQMCHKFGVDPINCPPSAPGGNCSPPIPADFFGPGSDPFDGTICLVGEPLGQTQWGDFAEADTLISRTEDPFDRCSMPSGSPSTVNLEVVALSLVDDSEPITVTFNGGQNPESWDVAVDLSTVTPPAGSLTATKTHCNGGTYTSVLNVLPRFTFTKVSDPGQVQVLDTGQAGLPPVSLIQNDAAPWVHDVDPNLGLTFDPCSDFHPGVEEGNPALDCDCDGNQVRDKCDIEADPSLDCNLNAVPDSCDVLAASSPDCNDNGVPDECEMSAPAVPAGPHDIQKNRFVSFAPNNPACVAIMVELLDLACSSTGKKCSSDTECKICDAGANVGEACSRSFQCSGGDCVISGETCDEQSLPIQLGWVGDPFVPDTDRVPPGTFGARVVQNMPAPRNWTEDPLHVGDCEIAPAQTYGFSATIDGVSFSPRLVLGTTPRPDGKSWGDLVGNFDGTNWTPPNFLLGVDDVTAIIKFLVISPTSPHITRVDLVGEVPNWLVNASDLQTVIGAFVGKTYPPVSFPNTGGPADCP